MANDPFAPLERARRWLTVAILAVLTWQYARMPIDASVEPGFLHLPDLVFHEAGHVLFAPFGRFMTVLGGSLFQVLVPVICLVAFLRQNNAVGAAICTWWTGQNLIDLAPYIADARRLQLVLLGGYTGAEVEGHDWEYLLTTLRAMRHDVALGRSAQALGTLLMIAAVVWSVRLAVRDEV
ncbi:MAG TPA: hypothetical protein VL173_13570 [Vicinamibacterales bacterium]|nr:hypothetical protein [Vicinamibacterales bacterium]